jgi:hypothetical protein
MISYPIFVQAGVNKTLREQALAKLEKLGCIADRWVADSLGP